MPEESRTNTRLTRNHRKETPLYFANFTLYPVYRPYRHRQKLTPKPSRTTNRDSAREKVRGTRVAKRDRKGKAENRPKAINYPKTKKTQTPTIPKLSKQTTHKTHKSTKFHTFKRKAHYYTKLD